MNGVERRIRVNAGGRRVGVTDRPEHGVTDRPPSVTAVTALGPLEPGPGPERGAGRPRGTLKFGPGTLRSGRLALLGGCLHCFSQS